MRLMTWRTLSIGPYRRKLLRAAGRSALLAHRRRLARVVW
jgi:hypothetical protein